MVEELKKPTLFQSKSFSLNYTEGCLKERKQRIESNEIVHYLHDDMTLRPQVNDKQKNPCSQSPTSTRSPLKMLRSVYSHYDEDNGGREPMTARVPMKRRRSFMPTTAHSRSSLRFNETTSSSPGMTYKPTCPVFEMDEENDKDNVETERSKVRAKRRNSFMPITLHGISLSPKPGVKKQSISSLQQTAKPPFLRTLSFCASSDTCNTETDYSDHTRSTTGTPTSSSSDLQQQNDDQTIEAVSLMHNSHANTYFDVDISSSSTVSSRNACDEGSCLKETYETSMSLMRSVSLVVGMFLWHYMKAVGLLLSLNLKRSLARIWMTLFDIVVEAISLTVELISYAIPIMLRLFETSMIWFVQQVYVRRVFIFLHDTFKHRKKSDDVADDTANNEPISCPTEKGNRRPIRFLYVSKETMRRRSIRVGSYTD